MFGKNPKRPAINSDGTSLDVQEIFPTIQGEGPYTGHPSVFLRLGGCNLACEFCDTEFESFKNIATDDVIERIKELSVSDSGNRVRELVVITGGEPFRQNIEYLCQKLIAENFKVQIETNGTLYRPIPEGIEIVCSPKNTGKGYGQIRDDLLARVNAFKFIISESNTDYNNVPDVGQKKYSTPVYIQPMDEYNEIKNQKNLERVKYLAEQSGYRISLQTHKIMNIP